MYKKPIIIFGLVLPLLATVVLAVGCFVAKSKLTARFEEKQQKYRVYDQNRKAAQVIEEQIGKQRPHIERWADDLAQETASAVSGNLRAIAEKLPPREFQQTAFDRPTEPGGFGTISAQRSSRVRVGFRGSFRTVQKAFLELETRMPRLQLEDLTVTPVPGPTPQLGFQATYTSWEQ